MIILFYISSMRDNHFHNYIFTLSSHFYAVYVSGFILVRFLMSFLSYLVRGMAKGARIVMDAGKPGRERVSSTQLDFTVCMHG
jgi:hypothetical protein